MFKDILGTIGNTIFGIVAVVGTWVLASFFGYIDYYPTELLALFFG